MSTTDVLTRIDSDLNLSLERLKALLRFPSISTDPAHKTDCAKTADHLAADLRSTGFEASVRKTSGHPIVIAHTPDESIGNKKAPHLLFYGHYDVQPVDPPELWDTSPFEPTLEETPKGTIIRARGASDDKGQLMTFVEACRAWKAVHGNFPCRLTLFFEGEEESGSPSLIPFMQENAKELKADIALICDTGLFADQTPAIVTMLRGLLGEEITLRGASKDLHSGMYGGISLNPIRVLTRILGQLHDDQGKITLPGFYEGVTEMPASISSQWEALSFRHSNFLNEVGLSLPAGEKDKTPLEMIWSRPTAEINGIYGGYTGEGFKTVLPAEVKAKVSFRLVGTQDPHKIRETFREWVKAQLPADCKVTFKGYSTSAAVSMSAQHPAFEAAQVTLSEEWEHQAAFVGCGGSIPIAGHFKTYLDMEAMLIGFGRDNDQIHSPNEKYDLECFHKGIRSWTRLLGKLSA